LKVCARLLREAVVTIEGHLYPCTWFPSEAMVSAESGSLLAAWRDKLAEVRDRARRGEMPAICSVCSCYVPDPGDGGNGV